MRAILASFLSLLAAPLPLTAQEPVYFADPNLELVVETALGISDPTPADMLGLTRLYGVERSIADLTGLDGNQLHGGKRDGVGPHRRAQGKGPAGVLQVRGRLLYEIAPCLVHPIEEQDMAEKREIGQSRCIARVQLDPTDGIGL